MISKEEEKVQAIELRKSGMSYNEIRERVPVSKSSLSLWLRSVGLAKRHQRRLTEKQRTSQQKGVRLVHERRLEKTRLIKEKASLEIISLSLRERWLIGIALHWAEGSKEKDRAVPVRFTNSDPAMIIFFREWVLDFLHIDPGDITYTLAIHEKSPQRFSAMKFWSTLLNIEPGEFKITLKKHNPSPKRKNIGKNYRGLIRLSVKRSTDMNRKIAGWIDGIIRQTQIIGE